ncbi:hypothetical protein HYPSUDRAFT_190332 [Hypholoma sublateritium FD-334 SS-4]|uniref:Polysaccharide biosynthesis protein C-terminal domain-containing protein n=1 Tax=Hypholoma sublateritium (strain FD-334 SS-4) TaxID=945553 RepID=A0A0D2NJ89_HYPSF|nr:hypothetical protein HYPSUDRAFT_190332 [Hypholoma sublateritium FD-334 SS-4]
MSYSSYAPLPAEDPDTPAEAEMDTLTHVDHVSESPGSVDDDVDRKSTKSRISAGDAVSGLVRFRASYHGALVLNLLTFLIPAVYSTLSKMWVANIDASLVSTTDAYTYFSCIIEVLNEGLPRAAWSTIGSGDTTKDTAEELLHRLSLTYTLISVQSALGLLLSVIFLFAAPGFVGAFVPGEVRATSVKYIRILAFDSLASTLNTAVSLGTRALDKPDVPLVMASVQTVIQIFLELALVSTVHVRGFTPTIHTTATIKLVCDLTGAAVGLAYFLYLSRKATAHMDAKRLAWFSRASLRELSLPGRWTFTESAVRNAIYLWQVHGVVAMGQAYATAWGVFNTIRWGLIMVPVNALEATSNTFVGHRWGVYRSSKSAPSSRASVSDIRFITAPALWSVGIVLLVECPMCIALSIRGAGPFARYLSNSEEVAAITAMMWKSIDWCYICYGVSTQLATILLATQTQWYLYQSLVSNIFYALPWAIALPEIGITPDTAWTYHKWVFGGSLVVSLGIIIVVDGLWAARLRGRRFLKRSTALASCS